MDNKTYKRLRMALGLSQREIAEKLGISVNYVAMMESGKRVVAELQERKIMDLIVEAGRNKDPVFELIQKVLTDHR